MVRIAFVAAWWLLAASALAAAPTVQLEDLTSPELRDEVAGGKTTILIPVGGTEQNGAHMTLGKHNVRVKALSARVASELGNAIVAPVIAYVPEGTIDPPSQHMRHAGTISIPEDAFEKVVESAARSLRRHGFRDIVFLGDHGGYRKSLAKVADRLNREWAASGARVHALPEYYEELEHAGRADTSLMLAIDPGVVRSSRLSGEPARATPDEGRRLADRIVARTVESIRKAVRR